MIHTKQGKPRLCNSQFYYHKTREQWRENFVEQYHTIHATSAAMYNQKRQTGTPAWVSVAGMFDITKWYDWLTFCHIVPYIAKRNPEHRRVKTVEITLTREVNIPGDPKFSRFLEDNAWPESQEKTIRVVP